MYLAELVRVAKAITYARQNIIRHGEFDWVEFLLEVDDFESTKLVELYVSDTE